MCSNEYNNEIWIDSIYHNEDRAYAVRKERYIEHFEKQINALEEDAKSSMSSRVVWFVSKYELNWLAEIRLSGQGGAMPPVSIAPLGAFNSLGLLPIYR